MIYYAVIPYFICYLFPFQCPLHKHDIPGTYIRVFFPYHKLYHIINNILIIILLMFLKRLAHKCYPSTFIIPSHPVSHVIVIIFHQLTTNTSLCAQVFSPSSPILLLTTPTTLTVEHHAMQPTDYTGALSLHPMSRSFAEDRRIRLDHSQSSKPGRRQFFCHLVL